MSETGSEIRPMTAAQAASEGGKARAEKLSPDERSEIARKAAEARWNQGVIRATHTGEMNIGAITIPCAVLEDGTRVLTQEGFYKAIGRSGKPASGRGSQVEKVAPFLDLNNLKPFVSEELADSTKPFIFQVPSGSRAYGFRAELLPQVCEVYLKARDARALLKSQQRFATACDILMRGLAHVGIFALIDEATGYQEVRDKKALQAILDRYLRHEFAAWAKRFPEEFYREMFRLRGWTWKGMKVNRPQCVATYTKDLIYKRLAPGILAELEQRNPVQINGRRKSAHHQWFTEDIGHPALAQHLHAVIGLMRATPADDWTFFIRLLDRAFPKKGDSIQLDIYDAGVPINPPD